MKDKYDEAIEYLTEHPEGIIHCWDFPERVKAGCLFKKVGNSEKDLFVGALHR